MMPRGLGDEMGLGGWTRAVRAGEVVALDCAADRRVAGLHGPYYLPNLRRLS
jgi:hypothetical protein